MFVFLLPYVCASLWGHVGEDAEKLRSSSIEREEASPHQIKVAFKWGIWELSMEEYLIHKLSAVMPQDYEKEAMKAQAVLLRTELIQALREQAGQSLTLTGEGFEDWYEEDIYSEAFAAWRQAVEETEGLYLSWEGEAVQASYFPLSNGRTRDAAKVWETDRRPYLRSVDCVQDKASPSYSSSARVSRAEYIRAMQSKLGGVYTEQEIWEQVEFVYDDAGYVTKVLFTAEDEDKESAQIDGETYRHLFGLASASFEVEKEERQIIFRVKGVGHGFGMSQYGANCMALNGKTYDEILEEFFYRTELAKFE